MWVPKDLLKEGLKTESFVVTQDATLKEELSKFWNYESLGIKGEEPTLYDSFADQVGFLYH